MPSFLIGTAWVLPCAYFSVWCNTGQCHHSKRGGKKIIKHPLDTPPWRVSCGKHVWPIPPLAVFYWFISMDLQQGAITELQKAKMQSPRGLLYCRKSGEGTEGWIFFWFLKEFWCLFCWHAQYRCSGWAVSMDAGTAGVTVALRWTGPARGTWQGSSQESGKHLLVSLFGDFFDKSQLESQRKWAWERGRTTFTCSGRGGTRKAAQCHGLHLSLTLNEAQNITQISLLLSGGLSETLGSLAQNEGNNEGKASRRVHATKWKFILPSTVSSLLLPLVTQFSPVSRY